VNGECETMCVCIDDCVLPPLYLPRTALSLSSPLSRSPSPSPSASFMSPPSLCAHVLSEWAEPSVVSERVEPWSLCPELMVFSLKTFLSYALLLVGYILVFWCISVV